MTRSILYLLIGLLISSCGSNKPDSFGSPVVDTNTNPPSKECKLVANSVQVKISMWQAWTAKIKEQHYISSDQMTDFKSKYEDARSEILSYARSVGNAFQASRSINTVSANFETIHAFSFLADSLRFGSFREFSRSGTGQENIAARVEKMKFEIVTQRCEDDLKVNCIGANKDSVKLQFDNIKMKPFDEL